MDDLFFDAFIKPARSKHRVGLFYIHLQTEDLP